MKCKVINCSGDADSYPYGIYHEYCKHHQEEIEQGQQGLNRSIDREKVGLDRENSTLWNYIEFLLPYAPKGFPNSSTKDYMLKSIQSGLRHHTRERWNKNLSVGRVLKKGLSGDTTNEPQGIQDAVKKMSDNFANEIDSNLLKLKKLKIEEPDSEDKRSLE